VNHAGFDDAKKSFLDNDYHKKGGECECMNIGFWWCQSRIKQGFLQGYFNKHSKVKHCFKINSRSSKQDQEKDKALNNQLVDWFFP